MKSSPYFQNALQKDSNTRPLSLFVGRKQERRRLLATIGSSFSSRQAVAGRSGVGKTTLVQAAKADALKAGYWVADEPISITPQHSSDALLGQLLAGIYDAILTCRQDQSENDPVVKEACQLVDAMRLRSTTMNVSAMGFGVGGGSSEAISNPTSGLTLPARHTLRRLLNYAFENGFKGVLLHLNNLENLSEADAEQAANLLRSTRDNGLMLDGLHLIVVGATDAVRTVVNRHTQIRSVFSRPMILEQLTLSDVHELLDNRYKALQIDANKSLRKPIEDSVVEQLYNFFRGDLRGMLKSLEDGIQTLLLDVTDAPALPVNPNDLLLVLKEQNQEELAEELGPTNWDRVLKWALVDPDSIQTQTTLANIWRIKQVSTIMKDLTEAGAVETLPKRSDREIQYLLTGKARLATFPEPG